MPASVAASVKLSRAAREELNERRTMPPLTTFFSIAKTARQTDSKLINEISKISTICDPFPSFSKWRELQTLTVFGAERFHSDAKSSLVMSAPENGRLKSGYYCRLEGELSNGAHKSDCSFCGQAAATIRRAIRLRLRRESILVACQSRTSVESNQLK